MDLDVVLLEGVFAHLVLILIGEEIHDFGAVIALELDHLAHVLVLNNSAIASFIQSADVTPSSERIATYHIPS